MPIEAITAVSAERFFSMEGVRYAALRFTGPTMSERVIVIQQKDDSNNWVIQWFGTVLYARIPCFTAASVWQLDGTRTRVRVEQRDASDVSPWYYPEITAPTAVTQGTAALAKIIINEQSRCQLYVDFGTAADFAYVAEHLVNVQKWFYPLGGTPGNRIIYYGTITEKPTIFDGNYFSEVGLFTPYPIAFRNPETQLFEWWGTDGNIFTTTSAPSYPLDLFAETVQWKNYDGTNAGDPATLKWPENAAVWPYQEGDLVRITIQTKFHGGDLQGNRRFYNAIESKKAPAVAPNQIFYGVIGRAVNFVLSGAGSEWSATGLPAGLSLSGSTISGIPTSAGSSVVEVTATNSLGTATGNVEILITSREGESVPVIGAGAAGTWGQALTQFVPYSVTIGATNSPTAWIANGLPIGMSINSAGLISGAPTEAGLFVAAVQAENIHGISAPVYVSFSVVSARGGASTDLLVPELVWDLLDGSLRPVEGDATQLRGKRGDTWSVLVKTRKGGRTIVPEFGSTGTLKASVRPKGIPTDEEAATASVTNPAITNGGYALTLTWNEEFSDEMDVAFEGELELQIFTTAGFVISSQSIPIVLEPDLVR